MEIERKSAVCCEFYELKEGEIFQYEGYIYMVINFNDVISSKVNAVNLSDGHLYKFDSDDMVGKVSGKLVIE